MKIKKNIITALIGVLVLLGIYFFCEQKTLGFRFHEILSSIPDDPRWDMPVLNEEQKAQIDALLGQTFTLMGKGGFCYAFLGEDQKTVLKFYTHTYLQPVSLWKDFKNISWDKLLLRRCIDPKALTPYLEFAFKSCTLLFTQAVEKTGLIYMHLNKSEALRSPVVLIDKIGVRHTIDLNQTEFVLQHRATILIDYIDEQMLEYRIDNAQRAIDNYLNCLLALCQLGIRDLDRGFRNNYGILEDGTVVAFDVSSFVEDFSLKCPGSYKKEIVLKTYNLAKWLKKHHPDLLTYYDEKLAHLIENA